MVQTWSTPQNFCFEYIIGWLVPRFMEKPMMVNSSAIIDNCGSRCVVTFPVFSFQAVRCISSSVVKEQFSSGTHQFYTEDQAVLFRDMSRFRATAPNTKSSLVHGPYGFPQCPTRPQFRTTSMQCQPGCWVNIVALSEFLSVLGFRPVKLNLVVVWVTKT